MAKKDFKNTGFVDQFLTGEEPQEIKQASPENFTVPEGYRLEREHKSERMQLLVRPTTKKQIKAAAAAQGISMNDFINQIFDEYFERLGKE